jgi:hypothetical protein
MTIVELAIPYSATETRKPTFSFLTVGFQDVKTIAGVKQRARIGRGATELSR